MGSEIYLEVYENPRAFFSSSSPIYLKFVDAILPRKGPVTRTMSKRLQEDWAKDAREGPRVLMSLRVDFGPMG